MSANDGSTGDSEPFERIKPHRDILRDIRQMQDNLEELENSVLRHEWLTLGGRGRFSFEECDKLCEGTASSMPYIQEAINELPDPYTTDTDRGASP